MKYFPRFPLLYYSFVPLLAIVASMTTVAPHAAETQTSMNCAPVHAGAGGGRFGRTVCADVVALDQMLVYNRFGSFNPFGMMFALRRDVVSTDRTPVDITAAQCDLRDGTESHDDPLSPGEVRLKDCKRPRPLVLRANVGDILHVRLANYLRSHSPGLSESFCKVPTTAPAASSLGDLFHAIRRWVSQGPADVVDHGEALCLPPSGSPGSEVDGNWPATRGLNFAIQGLTAFGIDEHSGDRIDPPRACLGLEAIAPGAEVHCYYEIEREGPFFIASTAAPSGGEGDGGSISHGLFGGVMVQKTGTSWYRSQVSKAAFAAAWPAAASGTRHAVAGIGGLANYETEVGGVPVLNMLDDRGEDAHELVHGDLNAIIHRPDVAETDEDEGIGFREFSVFFHDELKTFYTRNFEELGDFGSGQLAGVRDGFAINYGASGMGDMVIANRKGVGPAANCQECLYEEFFLTSWAHGDPALLEQFSDDPSNVHHSYLNDPVTYRNFHAGPKETHVFHLHAHQWFAGNDRGRGSYLDSQTVGPQQGFTYNIYDGGLEVYHPGTGGGEGWYETLGSGNRNRTPGDSIFHCHLYPHFAQGMWELWRVHDVLEDGTRKLPDGQWQAELSLAEMDAATRAKKRPGSVHQASGRWIEPAAGVDPSKTGTPIPAIVPLPDQAWPLLPTYPADPVQLNADGSVTEDDLGPVTPSSEIATFAGYPFYINGKPGHRPPQAPMDIARELDGNNVTDEYLDGGLPRHVVADATTRSFPFEAPALPPFDSPVASLVDAESNPISLEREAKQTQILAKALALGDMTMKLEDATLELLPYDGTAIERTAMAFHHEGELASGAALDLKTADGNPTSFSDAEAAYPSLGGSDRFAVNGAPAKPGAPFADPCGAPGALTVVGLPDVQGKLRRTATGGYEFFDGTTSFPVFYVDPGETPSGTEPATDAQVSNWIEWRRSDVNPNGRPVLFYENGSGATVIAMPLVIEEEDPFLRGLNQRFTSDPAVVGYRRFAASAVQVDMVTNRAGWHDPQARINVLTEKSDNYKMGGGRISPKVTASEEPFFFRALSGECIEFRHTNELPKDLELDDFQVKTPTDTIGQHIHLVKFDVTASDGSGNGWNYEDGTLAPDEIAARICAAKNTTSVADVTMSRMPGDLKIREYQDLSSSETLCVEDSPGHWTVNPTFDKEIWRLSLSDHRELFQTTTQRWFADPILSATRAPGDPSDGVGDADRTLRTVFSHDHFGPSSIQQHGFYTALVIEPQLAEICDTAKVDCTLPREDRALIVANEKHIGARKVIVDRLSLDPDSPDYREFALAVADFATLYDPRNQIENADVLDTAFPDKALDDGGPGSDLAKGMGMLVCEAGYARDEQLRNMVEICGSALGRDSANQWFGEEGNLPPAWLAARMPGDATAHSSLLAPNLLASGDGPAEVDELKEHMIQYRRMAAGYAPGDAHAPLARPVAPPERPESISVDHHDPYLVNYRGEPLPLRVGASSDSGSDCDLKDLTHWEGSLETGVAERCEISRQKTGTGAGAGGAEGHLGDLANVFLSPLHGDPVTPILDAFHGDPVQIRLIQGAQEVQHTFNLDGYNWPRNIDQPFPSGTPQRDDITPKTTLSKACEDHPMLSGMVPLARAGRPDQYRKWMAEGADGFTDAGDQEFWTKFEAMLAMCFNAAGRLSAQEIGISEHFEFRAAYRHDSSLPSPGGPIGAGDPDSLFKANSYIWLLRALNKIQPADSLLHFGSTDALWNGAWGLLRIHRKGILDVRADFGLRLQSTMQRLEREVEMAPDAPMPPDLEREIEDLLMEPYRQPRQLDPVQPRRLFMPGADTERLLLERQERVIEDGEIRDVAPTIELPLPLDLYRNRADQNLRQLPEPRKEMLQQRFGIQRAPGIFDDDPEPRSIFSFPDRPDLELVANCRLDAPFVYTAVVAIEAEAVFGNMTETGEFGTSYAKSLYDRNGLFFALIDPRVLLDPDAPEAVTPAMLDEPDSWASIPLTRVVEAVQATYDRPEPLVITVNAGDCVKLTLLNALQSEADDLGRKGLRDAPGDALMPPITSLNVDWDWNVIAAGENTPIYQEGVDDDHEVRPSARLAITLPLPVLNRQSTYARPVGMNPTWSLNGVDVADRATFDPTTVDLSINDRFFPVYKERTAQIEQIEFYVGRAVASDRGRFCPIATPVASAAPLSLLASAKELSQKLPAALKAARLGEDGQITLGNALGQMEAIAAEQQTMLDRLSDETSLDIDIRPPVPWARLGEAKDRRLLLDQQKQPRSTASTFLSGGESFTYTARLRDPGSEQEGEVMVDLETALALPLRRGEMSEDQAERILEGIDGLQNQLIERVDAAFPDAAIFDPLLPLFCTIDVNYVPYAFGALPIKSHGDVIGHAAQGLIGAIAAVPQGAEIGDVRAPKQSFPAAVARRGIDDLCVTAEEAAAPAEAKRSMLTEAEGACTNSVIVPRAPAHLQDWHGTATLLAPDPGGGADHAIRQFTLFWQDGLNLRDLDTTDVALVSGVDQKIVNDCEVCDDSYDLGERGVSYRSEPFHVRLRGENGNPTAIESHYNLNHFQFGEEFFPLKTGETGPAALPPMPVLRAKEGEEVVVHLVHGGGRARQRAFVTIAQDYDDLFPGFGFPRAALLAPGKAITASLTKPLEKGCYVWFDGPAQTRGAGAWGLLDVVAAADFGDADESSCKRL